MQTMDEQTWPGPADVAYFVLAQAGAWGETLRAFARFVGPVAGRRVLDAGSGPGLLPRLCADGGAALAVACDDSHAMAARAAALAASVPPVAAVVGSALRLPVAAGSFDAVLATNLLFLLPDRAAGVAEMARAARPGGLVAFLNPSETLSLSVASDFANARGWDGFRAFSFVNYGRLAEEHGSLSLPAWLALASAAGLADLHSETRAGGLIVFVSGRKLPVVERS